MPKSHILRDPAPRPAFALLPDPEPQQLQVLSKQDLKQPQRSDDSSDTETPVRRVFFWVEHSKRNEREKRKQISSHVMQDYVERKTSSKKRSPRVYLPRFLWVEKRQTVGQNIPSFPSIPYRSSSGSRSSSSPSPPNRFARKTPLCRLDAKARPIERRRRRPRRAVKQSRQSRSFQRPLGNDNVSLSQALQRSLSPNPSMFSGFGSDPFQTLPARCGKIEAEVIHTYLGVYPEHLYGIRKDAVFNPQRDMVFPQSYVHPAIFQWALLAGASYLRGKGRAIEVSYIFRRRELAYRFTNEWIKDPKKRFSDEMVLAVTAAVLTESRYGDPRSISAHVKGLKTILDKRGGINSLVGKSWHSCVIRCLHLTRCGLGMFNSSYDIKEMEQHADVLIEALRNIREFDLERRRQGPRPEREPALSMAPTIPVVENSRPSWSHRSESLLRAYDFCRSRSFAPGSPIYTILSSTYSQYRYTVIETLNYSHRAPKNSFIAVLLSLNIALWKYRNDLQGGIYYLTTLTRKLKVNSLSDKNGMAANIETLNWFLVMGGNDVKGRDGEWIHEEFLTKWAVIDAMGVIGKLEDETRGAVIDTLYGFLVDGECGSGENIPRRRSELDAEVLEAIRAQFLHIP